MNGKPPKTLPEWIDYLHAARAIPQTSPDYGDAQEAVRFALQRIQTLNTVANATDQAGAEQGKRIGSRSFLGDKAGGALDAGVAGLLHGASLGAGEPIAGLIAALTGGSFGEGAGRYRQGLENIGTQQPIAAPLGEMLGMGATAAVPVGQGVSGGTKIAQAASQGVRGPNMLARAMLGAAHTNVAPGAALGAVQGFSAGGEDPGDLRARIKGGMISAGAGAATQGAFGALGALRVPRWLPEVRKDIRAGMPKGTDPALVNEVEEAAVRAGLSREGYDADTQARILSAWRAGKTQVPAPLPPPTVRPGETITPKLRPGETAVPEPGTTQGIAIHGVRATPPAPPPDQRPWIGQTPENQAMPTKLQVAKSHKELKALIGQGVPPEQIKIDFYTRGGKLAQSVPPLPSVSPPSLARYSTADLQGMLFGHNHPVPVAQVRAELTRRLGLK